MNNIIANTAIGISVDASSTSKTINNVVNPLTVITTELFQNNTIDSTAARNV